jgi:predicted CXXCH cytochrome family protein
MMGMQNPMMGMQNPMMGMPGPNMGNMPGMGMPTPMMGMPTPMMQNMPGMGNQGGNMTPTNQNQNNNTNDSQNQNQQTNEPRQTEACIACHTYENADLLNVSVIANNFSGHSTHQNCIYCHRPHGSQFQGLLKQGINWNRNNRSCNTEACHPTYIHNPPLADTGIYYEMRPESNCNTYSCHVGSGQNSMLRYKVITSPEP